MHRRIRSSVVLGALVLTGSLGTLSLAAGAENRFTLLNGSDYSAKRGVIFGFENAGEGLKVGTLRLTLGVGDGKEWRWIENPGPFEIGRTYRLVLRVGATESSFEVREGSHGGTGRTLTNGYVSAAAPIGTNEIPAWASAPAAYVLVPISARIVAADGKAYAPSLRGLGPLTRLFRGPEPSKLPAGALDTGFTFETEVRIDPPAAAPSGAFLDRYGQIAAGNWPGKAVDDAGLRRDYEQEAKTLAALPKAPALDSYGGRLNIGWNERSTGYYRTLKRNGVWWLVSPKGNPLFYTGVCTAPSPFWDKTPVTGRESLFPSLPSKTNPDGTPNEMWAQGVWGDPATNAYVALHSAWLERRDGQTWKAKTLTDAVRRLRALGFSGMGKWSDGGGKIPDFPVLTPFVDKKGRPHWDPFDPVALVQLEASLRKQITPRRNDPNVVGWSCENEYDEIITTAEIRTLLTGSEATPARKALFKALSRTDATGLTDADVERARHAYAKAFYAALYGTVKRIDPDHLYLGFWIVPGWWQNDADWNLIAGACDVIGYDRYAPTFSDPTFAELLSRFDKPVLCGEFSFPPTYDSETEGERGFGRYFNHVTTEVEAGAGYSRWIADATRDPRCIGTLWFQYRDQPVLGRGPYVDGKPSTIAGENYAFGLLDRTDRIKWPLARAMRTANLGAFERRLASSKGGGGNRGGVKSDR